jgi:hypothetical protein
MFMMFEQALRCTGAALAMFVTLAACGRQTVDAAANPYEIVTQTRPESLEAYIKMFRPAYDGCALVRAAQKLPPPPPLIALPADFVMKRSTYLSSGSAYLIRHEEFSLVTEEESCKTRIGSIMTETVVREGKISGQMRERGGPAEVDAPTTWVRNASKEATDEASFTEKRLVGATDMRCLSPSLRGGMTLDKCAANTNTGLLRDATGDPITLHAREVVPVFNLVVLTEPVSLQIGKPVSPERIALSVAK